MSLSPARVAARRKLVESGIGAFHLVTALMTLASVLIVQAFVTDDFTIKYVSRYSESFQPLFFKITSYWGGLDGSIMFWVFLLACFGSIAVHVNRDRHRELIPYVVAVIAGVQMFFLFLMIIHNNPFNTFLTQVPPDGNWAEPAAAERVHGDPSAVALYRVRRHDDPVCVRHGGADHRTSRRCLASRSAALDDVRVDFPVVRAHARHDLGVRRARLGRILGMGSR